MNAAPTVRGLTPGESETPSSYRPRTRECAASDFDSPKNESTHEASEHGLEPWLSAWLATGHENHRDMK